MGDLGQDDIKALEHTRQRLLALHASLISLKQELYIEQPLPSWASLQSHSSLISTNLQSIAEQLSNNHALFASMVAFPLPQFPGRQENILGQIFRTKLEPEMEEWVEKGQNMALEGSKFSSTKLSDKERNELWQWAPSAANVEARKQKWGADYTLAEKLAGIESVVTGLTRELAEPPDGDGDDGDDDYEDDEDDEVEEADKMEGIEATNRPTGDLSSKSSIPQMSLEDIQRFMMTGRAGR